MRTETFLSVTLAALWLACGSSVAASLFPQLSGVGDKFTFLINADAHVNRQQPTPRNPRPHNVILREFVADANALTPPPAFVIFNGDIYERQAVPESTNHLIQIVKDLKALPIAVTGNHDVRDFDVDAIFRPVQRAFNGTTNDTFSFDCGQWHFVVLPTKELLNTPEKEAALLKWLDADLQANRARPTMVFMHYHVLPVGTSQLEFYTQSIDFKNRLLSSLTRLGNVKFVFSGHVHAGVLNSMKTAWTYKGANFIINPTGVRPRPFGEEYPEFDQEGGCYTRVVVDGKMVRLFGRQNRKTAEREFPPSFRAFDKAMDPRSLTEVWELPANPRLRNGGFEDGLDGWHSPYRYIADMSPGYELGSREDRRVSGTSAARVFVREKGQGWALGEFTELYQVVQSPVGKTPVIRFSYFPDDAEHGGGYVWLAGFKGSNVQCVMLFHWGPKMLPKHTLTRVISYVVSGGDNEGARLQILTRERQTTFWKLPAEAGRWHKVKINLAEAWNAGSGSSTGFASLGVDRFILGLGAWCADEPGSHSTGWFDDVGLDFSGSVEVSHIDGTLFDAQQQGLQLLVESDRGR